MYKKNTGKKHLLEFLPYEMPLREERLSEKIKTWRLFGYVQCEFEVPENLRKTFAHFAPNFRNSNVSRDDIGPFMKEYAEKEELLAQP